jgi:general secretion pathway protein F
MPDFTYEAMARSGAKSEGTIAAASEREAAMALDAKGLFPLSIALARKQVTGAKSGGGFFTKRVKGRHLAVFYSQLADLLHTGVPLLRSLELLEKQSVNPTLQAVLREIRGKVADGTGARRPWPRIPVCSTNSP